MTKTKVKIINGSVRLPVCYICAFEGIVEKLCINDGDVPPKAFPVIEDGEQSIRYGTAQISWSVYGVKMFVFKKRLGFGWWDDYTLSLKQVAKLNASITNELDYI